MSADIVRRFGGVYFDLRRSVLGLDEAKRAQKTDKAKQLPTSIHSSLRRAD